MSRERCFHEQFNGICKTAAGHHAQRCGYNLDLCGYPHEEEEILPPMDLIQRYEEQRASLNAEIDRVLFEIQSILGKG